MIKMDEHKPYYGGGDNPYEAIKVIVAWGLNFQLGSALKYICRAGKKDSETVLEDLEKAKWYIEYEIRLLRIAVTERAREETRERNLKNAVDLLSSQFESGQ